MIEYLDIVDEYNRVIGKAPRGEIYEKKLTHRIVHIFVIHPKENKVFVQKRSDKVDYLPGFFCTSAGGHVQSGESYEQAAKRELEEELGINLNLSKVHAMQFVSGGLKRFIQIFIGYAKEGFQFNDERVAGGEFMDMDELYDILYRSDQIHPQ